MSRTMIEDALAALDPAWIILADLDIGAPPDALATDYALLHPTRGVALIDVVAASDRVPSPAAAARHGSLSAQRFQRFLDSEGFTSFFPGTLPIVHLFAPADGADLADRLAAAFAAADPATVADPDWAEAVNGLLVSPLDAAPPPTAPPGPMPPPTRHDASRGSLDAAAALRPTFGLNVSPEDDVWRLRSDTRARSPGGHPGDDEASIGARRRRWPLVLLAAAAVAAWAGWITTTQHDDSRPEAGSELALAPPPASPIPPLLPGTPSQPPDPLAPKVIAPSPTGGATAIPSPSASPQPRAAWGSPPSTEVASTEPAPADQLPRHDDPARIVRPETKPQVEKPVAKVKPPSRPAPAPASVKTETREPAAPPPHRTATAVAEAVPDVPRLRQPASEGPPIDARDLPPLEQPEAPPHSPATAHSDAPAADAADAGSQASHAPPALPPAPLVAAAPVTPPRPAPPIASETNLAQAMQAGAETGTTTPDGRICRAYSATRTILGKAQAVKGLACRLPDGRWQLVTEMPEP
jgi:hypothetical protein